MIPKIIHYCWFGHNEIPDELKTYIESWHKFCPDYKIIMWNEDNFDVNSQSFTKSAYELKKYAYVSDYVRAHALNLYGGIYLDTDVEIKKNFDVFLENDAFSGFEQSGIPFATAIWGAKKEHTLTRRVLEYYQDRIYTAAEQPNPVLLSRLVEQYFGINIAKDEKQMGSDGIDLVVIYPTETFCLDLNMSYATHHFSGSWLPGKNVTFKDYVHSHYHLSKALSYTRNSNISILKGIASSLTFSQAMKVFIFNGYYNLRKLWKK